jgi:hypothetical protein
VGKSHITELLVQWSMGAFVVWILIILQNYWCSGVWEHMLCGNEAYYRTIGAVVYGNICCVGMNHFTEVLVQWSMGAFVFRNTFSIIFVHTN